MVREPLWGRRRRKGRGRSVFRWVQGHPGPAGYGFGRNGSGGGPAQGASLGNGLADEVQGKAGEGDKEGTVEGKGTVGTGKTEADEAEWQKEMLSGMEEMEGARAEHVPVDAVLGMLPVVEVLEGAGLAVVEGDDFLLKGKIVLEKNGGIHYDRGRRVHAVRQVSAPVFCGKGPAWGSVWGPSILWIPEYYSRYSGIREG